MHQHANRGTNRLARWACGLWLAGSAAAFGADAKVAYFNQREIEFPIQLGKGRERVKELQLHVSRDQGATWEKKATVPADRQKFKTRAAGDGEVWFTLAFVDQDGKQSPTDVSKGRIWRVVIDTVPPQVELSPIAPHPGPNGLVCGVQWRLADPNLNLETLRVKLKTDKETSWHDLRHSGQMEGRLEWPCDGQSAFQVQVAVEDHAKNQGMKELAIPGVNPPAGSSAAALPPREPPPGLAFAPLVEAPAPLAGAKPPALPAFGADDPLALPPLPALRNDAPPPAVRADAPPPAAAPSDLPVSWGNPVRERSPGPRTFSGGPSEDDLRMPPPAARPAASAPRRNPAPAPLPVANAKPKYDPTRVDLPPDAEDQSPERTLASNQPAGSAATVRKPALRRDSEVKQAAAEEARVPAAPPKDEAPAIKLVGSSRFALSYDISGAGPAGVGKVELFATKDAGRTWRKVCEDPDLQSPIDVELDGEGEYGLSIVVTNKAGVGQQPPRDGEAPQLRMHVDQTAPVIDFYKPMPDPQRPREALALSWSSEDKHAAPRAVDLYFSERPEVGWQRIAGGLPAAGSFSWTLPEGVPHQIYFKAVCRDQCGNQAQATTPAPVMVDLSNPQGRLSGVVDVLPAATPAPRRLD